MAGEEDGIERRPIQEIFNKTYETQELTEYEGERKQEVDGSFQIFGLKLRTTHFCHSKYAVLTKVKRQTHRNNKRPLKSRNLTQNNRDCFCR